MVGPTKPEDKDVGPEVGTDDEIVDMGLETGEPKIATNVDGGGVVTVAMVVGTSVGVEVDGPEMGEVDIVGIPVLEPDELRGNVFEGSEDPVPPTDPSVVRG